MIYAGFFLCAIAIFIAGKKLSFYGDVIATLTGMGKAWIGLILMASVTSLPELMVSISSAAIVKSADFAVGDILGACSLNLLMLGLLDAFVPKRQALFGTASQSHILAAALGIFLVATAGIGLFLPDDIVITPGLGITSFSFLVIYFLSMRLIYKYRKKSVAEVLTEDDKSRVEGMTLKHAAIRFALLALIIIIAALFLPYFAEKIAEQTGLGKTFIGTLLLAISTCMPEMAVSYGAARLGSFDLAVGNLLGSNIFNIFILFIGDLFYTQGHLLKDASDINLISVFAVILMSTVAIAGLTYRPKGKRYLLAWDALLIFIIYIINMILLYKMS